MAEDMGILSVAYIVSHEIDRKTVGTLWLTVDLHLSIKVFTMADVLKCDILTKPESVREVHPTPCQGPSLASNLSDNSVIL